MNELTRSPQKFHASLKQLIGFEKPWHILQSAEKPQRVQEICSSICWTEFRRYLLPLYTRPTECGCRDGVKVMCRVRQAAEYSEELYWLL